MAFQTESDAELCGPGPQDFGPGWSPYHVLPFSESFEEWERRVSADPRPLAEIVAGLQALMVAAAPLLLEQGFLLNPDYNPFADEPVADNPVVIDGQ